MKITLTDMCSSISSEILPGIYGRMTTDRGGAIKTLIIDAVQYAKLKLMLKELEELRRYESGDIGNV